MKHLNKWLVSTLSFLWPVLSYGYNVANDAYDPEPYSSGGFSMPTPSQLFGAIGLIIGSIAGHFWLYVSYCEWKERKSKDKQPSACDSWPLTIAGYLFTSMAMSLSLMFLLKGTVSKDALLIAFFCLSGIYCGLFTLFRRF